MEQFLVALAAYAAGYFVGGPLLTLLHELGHALPAALLARSRVTVNQGARPSLLRFSLWRLDFRLRPLVGFRTAWFGFCESEAADVSRAKRIVISAAGPAPRCSRSSCCRCSRGACPIRLPGSSGPRRSAPPPSSS